MKHKSRTEYSIMNISVGLVGYIANTLMGFVCRMVFVRCLSAEYLGINGLFSNILSMLSLAELGIGTAIVYALYKPLAEDDHEKVASLMKFYGAAYRIIGCVVAIIGLCLLPFLDIIIRDTPDIKENIYIIYVVYLFNTCLTYFFSYRGSLLVAAQRNYVQTGWSYIITTLQSVIQIVVLLATKEYFLYLGIQTVGTFIYNILVSQWAKHDYPYITNKNIKPLPKNEKWSLIKNVKALTVNKLTDLLVNSTDNIIITYFNGLVAVGAASNYTLLSGTLSTITNQLFNGLTASVGNLNAIENEEYKYKFFKILQMANFFIFGWATIGILFVSEDMVGLFFGSHYILSRSISFVLALNFYLVTMQSAINTYRSTMGLFKYGQYTLIFTAATNLILSIWLGKIWGLFGIYIATSFARMLTNTWYIPYAVFKHGLKRHPMEYFRQYLIYAFVLIIDGGVCYLFCSLCQFSYLVNTLVKIVICSIVPNIMFWVFFHKTEEFMFLKDKFIELFRRMGKRKKSS